MTIAGMIVWNGRLCGSRRLSVLVVEGEQAAAVLHARSRRRPATMPRAEAEVVALDQRAAVAVLVDDASGRSCRRAPSFGSPGGDVGRRLVQVDQLAAARRRTPSRSAPSTGTLRERRVGVELRPVGEGELLGLDEQVPVVRRAVGPSFLQVVALRAG